MAVTCRLFRCAAPNRRADGQDGGEGSDAADQKLEGITVK